MSFTNRIKQMQSFFSSNFTGVPAAQIVWDGLESATLNKSNAWVSVTISPNIANFASISKSNRKVRHEGQFIVQVFTNKNIPSEAANTIVDAISSTLENKSTNGIRFRTTRINRVGIIDGYYQTNTLTDYVYDETVQGA